MKNIILALLVIVIAGGAGYGLQHYLQSNKQPLKSARPGPDKASVIGIKRPAFELKDIEGQMRNIDEWNGKVVLVNFWATWCPPCKKEMPAFIELQEQYSKQGFQVIGIALDDEDSVRDFANTLGVEYPLMPADHAGLQLSRDYGNHIGALPFSVFVGRDGIITQTHIGELTKSQVEAIIEPMLPAK
ncbi:MAG TPA: TlpA family protein disulfide reductase [Gammaproteobacteria bacterium]|nr:TlpA family protein disulfide reductase [Gammaproteobacteria bacterium]